ncbi:hypothetical protein T265_07609 [Opisthorchis viverrini]|uniref:PAS domain-containing protein n=1 Tax=Opisthorchis viverrini TaxID=6198 RepID=A0A074ZBZ1_OPIVI|nr:hypothetical protein T265_07609 [Opisthorchis viverrini]KER24826.1 hypothetical protein T265_07609 [Opisthorchis viverrini]
MQSNCTAQRTKLWPSTLPELPTFSSIEHLYTIIRPWSVASFSASCIFRFSSWKNSAFVLGNALTQHFPIVYCSDGFLVLTRYPRASVMSRSSMCHFLWGPTTSAKDRATILHTFCQQTELTMELTLYKRTGKAGGDGVMFS